MKDGSKSGKGSAAVGSKNTIYGNQAYAIGAGNTISFRYCCDHDGKQTAVVQVLTQDKITTVTAGTVKGNMSPVHSAIRIVLQPIVLMQ